MADATTTTQNPSQQIQEKLREFQSRAAPQIEDARRQLMDIGTSVTQFIRERPGACLVGAVAMGFLVGRMASRR